MHLFNNVLLYLNLCRKYTNLSDAEPTLTHMSILKLYQERHVSNKSMMVEIYYMYYNLIFKELYNTAI